MRTMATCLLAAALVGLTIAPSRLDLDPGLDARGEPAPHADPWTPQQADAARAMRLRHLMTVTSLVVGDRLGNNRSDIEVAADGTVFIADPDFSRICVFEMDGARRLCFGEEGALPGKLQYIKAMVLAPDGKLLVQDSPDSTFGDPSSKTGRLQRFTPRGELIDGQELPFILKAAGPDGSLYGWNVDRRLVRMAPDGVITEGGLAGAEDRTPFELVGSIAVGPTGEVFVAKFEPVEVRRYGPGGQLIGTWGEPGDERGHLADRFILRAGTDGNLLALSWSATVLGGGYAVQRFTPDGALLTSFRPAAHAADGVFGPGFTDAAQAHDGSIFVAVGGKGILQRHSPEGQRLAVWLNEGGEAQWSMPDSVGLFGEADGSVMSVGREGDWVKVSAAGAILGRGRVPFPPGMEPDFGVFSATRRPNGDVCVINTLGDAWCFDAAGKVTARWMWTDPAELGRESAPGFIAAGSDDQLWVSDSLGGRLLQFDADGGKLGETPLPVPQELRFGQCQNTMAPFSEQPLLPLAVESDGSVLVLEQCLYEGGPPIGKPGVHRVSATGEHLWRRDLAELFHLDPAPEILFVKTLSALPSGELLVSATLYSSAQPPPPPDALWLLDPDSTDAALPLDLGRDAKGLEIRAFRATLAGPDRVWTTREDAFSSYNGDLDAFALEADGPVATPTAGTPAPSSTAPATTTGTRPNALWLPWLER